MTAVCQYETSLTVGRLEETLKLSSERHNVEFKCWKKSCPTFITRNQLDLLENGFANRFLFLTGFSPLLLY